MEVMNFLEEEGVLSLMTEFVCDKDNAVASMFKEDERLRRITIRYDPGCSSKSEMLIALVVLYAGHTKKNFQKRLMTIFGAGKAYVGYPPRIAKC